MEPSTLAILHMKVAEHYQEIHLLLEKIGNLTQQPEEAPAKLEPKKRSPRTRKPAEVKTNYAAAIRDAAATLALHTENSEVTLNGILELLSTTGSNLEKERSKPTSLISVVLAHTPGFTKVSPGVYKYSKPTETE